MRYDNLLQRLGLMLVLVTVWCAHVAAQLPPTQEAQAHENMNWYLDDVVERTFIGRNYFEYYYMPSASEVKQQRDKGEVTYFLNTPGRYSVKKAQQAIDDIMAGFDDVEAVTDWRPGNSNNVVKDFRHEANRFRFSIGRKQVDEGGVYFVSVTEAANHYQSLSGKNQKEDDDDEPEVAEKVVSKDKKATAATKRSTRQRKQVREKVETAERTPVQAEEDETQPVMTEAERRAQARAEEKRQKELAKQQKEAEKRQREAEKQRLKEQQRQEKAQKELEKKQLQEEKRQQREAEKQRQQAEKQQAAAKQVTYYYHDLVLWLSEKYDYVVLASEENGCTIASSAVTDQEMAKLTIKNALKPHKAKMSVPWTFNEQTGKVEAGYTIGTNVLVFAVGEQDGKITVALTELTQDEFEDFKNNLHNR